MWQIYTARGENSCLKISLNITQIRFTLPTCISVASDSEKCFAEYSSNCSLKDLWKENTGF